VDIAQTPQVFPPFNLMYPLSPQLVPQEFLMCHKPPRLATKVTPWFNLVAQFEKIPDLYNDQFEASTATDTGYFYKKSA
jgi:hypothetical protein